MPELPEVETVKRGLEELVVGREIKYAENDNPKSFPNAQSDVDAFLIGAKIESIERRGKALVISLSTDHVLLAHLRMTGQLVYVSGEDERWGAGHPNDSLRAELPDNSTRVTLTFRDGSKLFFNDQRKFGFMKILPQYLVEDDSFIKRLGPEPLAKAFTDKIFVQRMRKRSGTTVKAALLDQSTLAGVGNIYADESLWSAKIHPLERVKDINDSRLSLLKKEIVKVLIKSIQSGGSTDKNYVNAKGEKGSFLEFANVFRREGKPCLRCGTQIEKIRVAGRGTHICPNCQISPAERSQ